MDRCPICNFFITSPNCWVKYHVRYPKIKGTASYALSLPLRSYNKKWTGEIAILACKYCNYTEYCLRNNKQGGSKVYSRFAKVLKYQAKFGVII